MKANKICLIALTGLILVVSASGIACAQWTGTEASYCNNQNYALWNTQINGEQSISPSSTYSFGPNTFENELISNGNMYFQLYGNDDRSGSTYTSDVGSGGYYVVSPSYYGQLESPSSSGWDCVYVSHNYGTSSGSYPIQVTPQGELDSTIT